MSESKTTKEKPTTSVKTYTIAQLRSCCQELFGVSDATFAGATLGLEGRFTEEQMRTRLEAWGKETIK